MKKRNIFIGGAWPYANNSLHIGHIAALLPGDIIARYYRKVGDHVLYVSGTDCHGTPITLRARKESCSPQSIAEYYHREFSDCFSKLHFTFDNYAKTCDPFHVAFVQESIKCIQDHGYLYEKTEQQDFCNYCNQFLSDREIEGICPICGNLTKGDQCDQCMIPLNASELKSKHCKYCGTTVVSRPNRHLYWKLSAFQNEISEFFTSHKDYWRINAIHESCKYLTSGLKDRAITRQLEWGIDVPIDGFEDKKIYVWIDAVLGYISAGKYFCQQNGIDWESFYKEDYSLRSYFIHGKDNIPFHTIIYPALLIALKDHYQLPQFIVSCEYLNIANEKISKSKENGITVKELIEMYDSDTIRYYMIANSPEHKDSNFSFDILIQTHNKKLVGEYGNFINRNLAFLVKKFDGVIPNGIVNESVKSKIIDTYRIVGDFISKAELKSALQKIQELVQFANQYYDKQKPWISVKEDPEEFHNTTLTCLTLILNLANLFEPFIPTSSEKVFSFFSRKNNLDWEYLDVVPSSTLNEVSILFDRI